MSLLKHVNAQYTATPATNTGLFQSTTNSSNPFLPAGYGYPMGVSLFVNPDYYIPMMPTLSASDFGITSMPSLFNFDSSSSSLSSLNNNIFNIGNSGNKNPYKVSLSSGNLGKDIVAAARQYIGYNEKDGSYKLFTNGRKEAWCADFATYVTKQALRANGKTVPSGFGSSSVAGLKRWGQNNGRYVTDVSQAKPGDIVIFNWSHTGIVKNILADGTVVTIEGNTSNKVAERKYSPRSGKINGFVQVA